MQFNVHYSYNLDVLNFINILTKADLYRGWHKGIYEQWSEVLSSQTRDCIQAAIEIKGNTMLGPMLSLVVSAVPNFERRSLIRMLSDPTLLQSHFSGYPYYDEESWPEKAAIFNALIPVIQDLETSGFREYWRRKRLPLIKQKQRQFHTYANKFQLDHEIELMLGQGTAPESITVYLCSFAAPHGIKLCGPRYIADTVFPKEITLGVAIHEMFHPPYDAQNLEEELERLGNDPLLQYAFETKDPRFGYATMSGFIEENVVEAMAIFICHKIGLEKDPLGYFAKHDGGSHMFSVLLFDYLGKHPKAIEQSFEAYFLELLQKMPIGSLDREYQAMMQ